MQSKLKPGITMHEWIKNIREQSNLTAYEIEKQIGIHKSTFSRLEHTKGRIPNKATVIAILWAVAPRDINNRNLLDDSFIKEKLREYEIIKKLEKKRKEYEE